MGRKYKQDKRRKKALRKLEEKIEHYRNAQLHYGRPAEEVETEIQKKFLGTLLEICTLRKRLGMNIKDKQLAKTEEEWM